MSLQNHGTAQTNGFLLNEATLMLGPLGSFLDLTVEEHSIGLFKQLQITNTRSFTGLTQGVRQTKVGMVLTEDTFAMTGQGFEFTPRQLAYQMGGAGYEYSTEQTARTTTASPAAAAANTVSVASAAAINVGDFITFSGADARHGLLYKVESKATNTLTLDRSLVKAVPTGATVYTLAAITPSIEANCSGAHYMSAKIVSSQPNCDPIIILVPKLQITSGLNIQFGVGDFSAQNFEISAMDLLPNEDGYDWVMANGQGRQIIPYMTKYATATP